MLCPPLSVQAESGHQMYPHKAVFKLQYEGKLSLLARGQQKLVQGQVQACQMKVIIAEVL